MLLHEQNAILSQARTARATLMHEIETAIELKRAPHYMRCVSSAGGEVYDLSQQLARLQADTIIRDAEQHLGASDFAVLVPRLLQIITDDTEDARKMYLQRTPVDTLCNMLSEAAAALRDASDAWLRVCEQDLQDLTEHPERMSWSNDDEARIVAEINGCYSDRSQANDAIETVATFRKAYGSHVSIEDKLQAWDDCQCMESRTTYLRDQIAERR